MHEPDVAVRLRGLTKVYRRRDGVNEALGCIDLDVPRGAFFGLLGPNGAGKSTLINILAGLVIKSAGEAVVWGYDIDTNPRLARASIGVVPQELNIDPFFTPRETLELQAGLYGVPARLRQTDEILAAVGLTDQAHVYARTLSGGMRRRLLVAKAMVHRPPVLVLDEPTAGVDVELRRQFWRYVAKLHADGTTILLTTHYLEEAERFCDRIAIIDHGRLIACESTESLVRRLDRKIVKLTIAGGLTAIPTSLQAWQTSITPLGRLAIAYQPSRMHIEEILSIVRAAGLVITDLSTEEAALEDIFLDLTAGGSGKRAQADHGRL
ncbi:MAG: ABC transporter ATP-binding protein [Alphaproteobacteria bacterium]|nr:ABC transporter ATP-binding protein [Alphaproteobacteria bacterium]